jgi:hypothetical protein
MTPDEFIAKTIESGASYYRKTKNKRLYEYWAYQNPKNNPPTLDDCLYQDWRSGGQTGGSCWDEGSHIHHPITGEPEPDFHDLDTVLEALCPKLTFLQYKKLMSAIIKNDDRTEDEYYGNYTVYSIKTVRLGDLYDKLKEMSLI